MAARKKKTKKTSRAKTTGSRAGAKGAKGAKRKPGVRSARAKKDEGSDIVYSDVRQQLRQSLLRRLR